MMPFEKQTCENYSIMLEIIRQDLTNRHFSPTITNLKNNMTRSDQNMFAITEAHSLRLYH